jgi:hypothetical protein
MGALMPSESLVVSGEKLEDGRPKNTYASPRGRAVALHLSTLGAR